MTSMFTNSNVYDNGKMKSMNSGKAVGRGRAVKTGDETSSDLQTQLDSAFGFVSSGNGTSSITSFDIINMFRMTIFLVCRYPNNNQCNHHMQQCTLLKEFGFNFTYTPNTEIHCPKVAKHHNEKAKKTEKKKKKKKASDATPAAASNPPASTSNTNWIPYISAQAGCNAANTFVTVGKGNSKTISKAEAK